jgi:hypothetical protein
MMHLALYVAVGPDTKQDLLYDPIVSWLSCFLPSHDCYIGSYLRKQDHVGLALSWMGCFDPPFLFSSFFRLHPLLIILTSDYLKQGRLRSANHPSLYFLSRPSFVVEFLSSLHGTWTVTIDFALDVSQLSRSKRTILILVTHQNRLFLFFLERHLHNDSSHCPCCQLLGRFDPSH